MLELPFKLPDGRTMGLLVTLPAAFPKERPQLAVSQPVIHPWVGYGGLLSFPSLSAWHHPGSRLAGVVQDAYSGLGGRPSTPAQPQAQQPNPAALQPPPAAYAQVLSPGRGAPQRAAADRQGGGASSSGQGSEAGPSSSQGGAALPSDFPVLQSMTTEQLAAALHGEDAFDALLQRVVEAGQTVQARTALHKSNLELAERNLQKEAALSDIRNQVAVIRGADYTGEAESFNELRQRIGDMVARVRPDVMVAKLQEVAQHVEGEAEAEVKRFMGGDRPVDEFVDRYGQLRTSYHKYDLKRQAALQTNIM